MRRDVEFLGHRPKRPILTFERSYKGSRYWCDRCPEMVFVVGPPPYGDPERNQILQLHDPALRAVLAPLPRQGWDAVTEAWDRGDYHRAIAEQPVGKSQQRTRRPSDPAARRRREGAQAWMLARRVQIGRVDEVLDELYEILEVDRSRRVEILGADRRLSRETLRCYWGDIPNTQRAASKQAFEDLPEAERNARLAAAARPE